MQFANALPTEALRCPGCNGEYLHHGAVSVFTRRREDADDGQHTHIPDGSDGTVVVDASMAGNPSVRRDGVRIHFWCELCAEHFSLCLAQHKGVTYVSWDRAWSPAARTRR